MLNRAAAIIACGVATVLTGCQSMDLLKAAPVEEVVDWHDARRAWSLRRDIYSACEHHLNDFRDGFLAGYQDVAAGGRGRPPVMPPDPYHGIGETDQSGRERLIAWYNGWSQGAYAAECDGVRKPAAIPPLDGLRATTIPEQ